MFLRFSTLKREEYPVFFEVNRWLTFAVAMALIGVAVRTVI